MRLAEGEEVAAVSILRRGALRLARWSRGDDGGGGSEGAAAKSEGGGREGEEATVGRGARGLGFEREKEAQPRP
jgi:hypothetical protein